MENLDEIFESALKRMGISRLPCAVFDEAPWSIRFRIGGEEDIYLGDHRKPNGAYVENAVDRAMTVYARLPAAPDILRIDGYRELALPWLPAPEQQAGDACYWRISGTPPFLRKLFREIIRAEIDPAGLEGLVSSVYFLSSREDVLFHLYDDRGADVAASQKESLRPLCASCRAWIPEHDQIDRVFGTEGAAPDA